MPNRTAEYLVGRELRDMLVRRDTLVKAVKYIKSQESANICSMTEKWRSAAQQASAYLLNDLKIKVDRMGGKSQWKKAAHRTSRNQYQVDDATERMEKLQEFMDSLEFENMGKYEQRDLKLRLEELEQACEKESSEVESDNEEGEFTMQEFFQFLKIDHSIVFDS